MSGALKRTCTRAARLNLTWIAREVEGIDEEASKWMSTFMKTIESKRPTSGERRIQVPAEDQAEYRIEKRRCQWMYLVGLLRPDYPSESLRRQMQLHTNILAHPNRPSIASSGSS